MPCPYTLFNPSQPCCVLLEQLIVIMVDNNDDTYNRAVEPDIGLNGWKKDLELFFETPNFFDITINLDDDSIGRADLNKFRMGIIAPTILPGTPRCEVFQGDKKGPLGLSLLKPLTEPFPEFINQTLELPVDNINLQTFINMYNVLASDLLNKPIPNVGFVQPILPVLLLLQQNFCTNIFNDRVGAGTPPITSSRIPSVNQFVQLLLDNNVTIFTGVSQTAWIVSVRSDLSFTIAQIALDLGLGSPGIDRVAFPVIDANNLPRGPEFPTF